MEEKPDLLSNLPEKIQRQVLSFLPLKEALRSSALSTTWRKLLTPLSLHVRGQSAINEALSKFSSSCVIPDRLNIVVEDQNDVTFAVSATKSDAELRLDFSDRQEKEGPDDRSRHYDLTASSMDCQRVACRFGALRGLHLQSVSFAGARVAGDVFAECNLLESLRLEKCVKLRGVTMKAASRLRCMAVLECPDIESVAVSAPELREFMYRGVVLPRIELESSPELVDAILDVRAMQSDLECEDAVCVLASLGEATTLTITSCLLQWMCSAGVIFSWLEWRFNRLKELRWMSSSMERSQIDSLACFLNICPSLEKLAIQIDESLGPTPCPYPHQQFHDCHLWMDYETVKSNTSKLKCLKVFELSRFTGDEGELLCMDLLLSKAVVLESMTVT